MLSDSCPVRANWLTDSPRTWDDSIVKAAFIGGVARAVAAKSCCDKCDDVEIDLNGARGSWEMLNSHQLTWCGSVIVACHPPSPCRFSHAFTLCFGRGVNLIRTQNFSAPTISIITSCRARPRQRPGKLRRNAPIEGLLRACDILTCSSNSSPWRR